MAILIMCFFYSGEIKTPLYWAIVVEDLETCSRWYQKVFEVELGQRFEADDGSWIIQNLTGEKFHIELIQDKRSEKVNKTNGFRKVGFSVDHLDFWLKKLKSASGQDIKVIHFEKMNQSFFQIKDPEGNTIQIFQSKPL